MQRSRPTDLELQSTQNASRTAEDELLETLFAPACGNRLNCPAFPTWQEVYSRYLRAQFDTNRAEFQPLFRVRHLEWPPSKNEMYRLMDRVAQSFLADRRREISIDEILTELCDENGSDFEDWEQEQLHYSRQAIFNSISWLTMLFQIPSRPVPDRFQIEVPAKVTGVRVQQDISEACLPLVRVIRGFGPLLPTSSEIDSTVNSHSPAFLHTTCLSIESLVRISRITIVWTDSFTNHLLFDPLSRVLSLYRHPSICALNSIQSGKKSTFEM